MQYNPSPKPALPADPPLMAREAAAVVGVSLATFWRGVGSGRLPSPVYPMPRAPRWFGSELRAALDGLRQTPREAMAARRDSKIPVRAA